MNLNKFKIFSLMFVLFLAYIFFVKIEIVAPGSGLIKGESKNIDVISPDSGFIDYVNIPPGKLVKRGELLLSYVNLDLFYENKTTLNILENLYKNKKRLISEKEILEKIITARHDGKFKTEFVFNFDIYKPSAIRFANKYNSLVKKQLNLGVELKLDDEKKLALENSLAHIEAKLNLLNKSNAPRINILSTMSEVEKIHNEIIDVTALSLSKRERVTNEQDEFDFEIVKYLEEIGNELIKVEGDIITKKGTLLSIKGKNDANAITAPFDGYLLPQKEEFTKNSYINKLQKIVSIQKDKNNSVIDGKIDTKYRPYIYVGAPVHIKVKSSAIKHDLKGIVNNISVDSYDKYEQDPAKGQYYKVVIALEGDYSKITGVDVDFFVTSREESFFSYITQAFSNEIYFTE